jgi:hypothetical protein
MTADNIPLLLGQRVPGQAVLEELMAVQSLARRRTWLQRVLGANPLSTDSQPWYKGALGEIAVGRILEQLGPEWLVLHAVPVGRGTSDIDHLIVGPAGVFTVNTKNHAGQSVWIADRTFMVAGKKTRHLHNAEFEASRASKLLSAATGGTIDVTPMVVVVDPKSMTIRSRPDHVAVLRDGQLLRWLRQRPCRLGPGEAAKIASAAVLAQTWHRKPVPTGDPEALQRSFSELRLLVDQARRRRAAWALSVPAAGLLILANAGQMAAAILQSLAGR